MSSNPNNDEMIRSIFSRDIVIILAKEIDPSDGAIVFQDYIDEDISYIPVFTSQEKLAKSFNNELPNKPMIKIQGDFFASLLIGDEIIKIDPGLKDEKVFPAQYIINVMKQEIQAVNETLKNAE